MNRHLGYIELIREDVDEQGIYRTLQEFVEDFLAANGKKIGDIRMLIGHGYASESGAAPTGSSDATPAP